MTDKRAKDVSDEMILRKLLWLRHGCEGLYGDDGEMQCGVCGIDFKRDTPNQIGARLEAIAWRSLDAMTSICVCGHDKGAHWESRGRCTTVYLSDNSGCDCQQFMTLAPDVRRATVVIKNVTYNPPDPEDD